MKLEFDSVEDLAYFLDWADKYRNAGALGMVGSVVDTARCADEPTTGAEQWPKIGTGSVAFDTPPARTAGEIEAEGRRQFAAEALSAEPAKRKRRTKAEIEAAAAAEARPEEAAALTAVAATFDTTQTPPAGTNPFEQAATAGGEPAGAAEGDAAAEDAAETVVTPFQHLTRAREFIAKHGMPKYNESFTKAGLDANVMGYSAFQRALHMTALDELDKG